MNENDFLKDYSVNDDYSAEVFKTFGAKCDDMEKPIKVTEKTEKNRSLAMAYIEWQKWQKIYPPDVAFSRGTIFTELDMPFIGEEAACDE